MDVSRFWQVRIAEPSKRLKRLDLLERDHVGVHSANRLRELEASLVRDGELSVVMVALEIRIVIVVEEVQEVVGHQADRPRRSSQRLGQTIPPAAASALGRLRRGRPGQGEGDPQD